MAVTTNQNNAPKESDSQRDVSLDALSDKMLLEILEAETTKSTGVMSQILLRVTKLIYERMEREKALGDQIIIQKRDITEYGRKVLSAYEHYNNLEQMYKEEHKRVLDLTDENAELKLKLAQQNGTEKLEAQLAQLKIDMEQQKNESNRIATKQAIGRRNVEEQLMAKEIALMDAQKKIREQEFQLAKQRQDIIQLQELVVHMQNGQHLPPTPSSAHQPSPVANP